MSISLSYSIFSKTSTCSSSSFFCSFSSVSIYATLSLNWLFCFTACCSCCSRSRTFCRSAYYSMSFWKLISMLSSKLFLHYGHSASSTVSRSFPEFASYSFNPAIMSSLSAISLAFVICSLVSTSNSFCTFSFSFYIFSADDFQ